MGKPTTTLIRGEEVLPVSIFHPWISEAEYHMPTSSLANCYRNLLTELHKDPTNQKNFAFRFVKGDDIWMSPFFGKNKEFVSLEWHQISTNDGNRKPERRTLSSFEKHCPDARPHWGKLHHFTKISQLKKMYPKFDEFEKVRKKLDPKGMFISQFWEDLQK